MNNSTFTGCGNVTQDPEMKYTDSGISKLKFSIACNRSWKNAKTDEWEEDTSYFNVIAWRKLADDAADVLEKGVGVIVTGRMEQRVWEKDDGTKQNIVEVVAENIAIQTRSISDFTRKRAGDNAEGGSKRATATSPRKQVEEELVKDPF